MPIYIVLSASLILEWRSYNWLQEHIALYNCIYWLLYCTTFVTGYHSVSEKTGTNTCA